jgi:hypothetical protein
MLVYVQLAKGQSAGDYPSDSIQRLCLFRKQKQLGTRSQWSYDCMSFVFDSKNASIVSKPRAEHMELGPLVECAELVYSYEL